MRKEVIGNATLYCGNCLEILPTLPKVDAVITDPPYGQAYRAKNATGKHGWLRSAPPTTRSCPDFVHGDDSPFDPSPWLNVAPCVLLWGAHRFASRLPAGMWLVWDKKPGIKGNSFGDGECAWLNRDGPVRIFRHLWNGLQVQAGSEEAARQPGTSAQVRRVHPTQKPVAVMRWCIERAGHPEFILDPYMGSGTTGVACAQMGRSFIGIERDPEHFSIACERIANAQSQQRLIA